MNTFFQLPNKNPVTCHVFSLDDVPSNPNYSVNAFAQKIRNLCWMLKSTGHKVIYYGFESCQVECDEKIIVTSDEVFMNAYPDRHKDLGYVNINNDNIDSKDAKYLKELWTLNTSYELRKRYTDGDFFFWMLPGCGQRDLYYETADWNVNHIEAGVGYIGAYLPYRVFESRFIRDYHHGCYHTNNFHINNLDDDVQQDVSQIRHYVYKRPNHEMQNDIVIPNSFDISDFDFKVKKDNYLLYLARVLHGKGIREAVEIAEKLEMKLIVAGPGDFKLETGKEPSKHIEVLGPVGPEKRKDLLANAKAVLSLTYPSLNEPTEIFGGAAVEAMLSGTVPITSDSGGFSDTIKNGWNGYRINYNDLDAGINAVETLDEIDPFNLRYAGLHFSTEKVALQYDAYIQYVYNTAKGINLPLPYYYRVWESEKIEFPQEWMTPVDVNIDNKEIDNV